jgi:hypothetical protein|tara:strand:+ start:115 stop:870 length:756 start_codon:yes stop_codon:yes gene_type:complete
MTETEKKALPPKDDSIIQDLLSKAPTQEAIEVDLPSQNKFYKLIEPSLPITLRPMNFEDEKSMVSNKNANSDVLNILLGRCVSNVSIGSILLFDKLFLLMKLRQISYGEDYTATISCPQCRRENNVSFDLSKLKINYVEDNATNPFEVKLPVIDKVVKVQFPRIEDEKYFSNLEGLTSNLWRFVEDIDGHSKKPIISGVLKKLPLKDMHVLMNTIQGKEYGLDTTVRFACNYCTYHEKMDLPITADFFTVS